MTTNKGRAQRSVRTGRDLGAVPGLWVPVAMGQGPADATQNETKYNETERNQTRHNDTKQDKSPQYTIQIKTDTARRNKTIHTHVRNQVFGIMVYYIV